MILPEDIEPIARGEKYEDPLQELLSERELGTITGGGSQLGEERSDGSQSVEFCALDIDVTRQDDALQLLRLQLPLLGAPVGSQLHYTRFGEKLQDVYRSGAWSLGEPRTFLHPFFEI